MKDNTSLSRYELNFQGLTVYADYHLEDKIINIDYVFAPTELRGTGAAGKLMEEICDMAKEKKMKIVPICSYASVWIRRHKQYHELLTD